jgi:hypothetical protein
LLNFNLYKNLFTNAYNLDLSFTDYLLDEINNNKLHRTIKAIRVDVFNELETNKQKVNYVTIHCTSWEQSLSRDLNRRVRSKAEYSISNLNLTL